jgi:precorrin-4 methylase
MANLFIPSLPLEIIMAGTVKEIVPPKKEESIDDTAALLAGADKAWEQYKRSQGTRVTNARELDALLDSLSSGIG